MGVFIEYRIYMQNPKINAIFWSHYNFIWGKNKQFLKKWKKFTKLFGNITEKTLEPSISGYHQDMDMRVGALDPHHSEVHFDGGHMVRGYTK